MTSIGNLTSKTASRFDPQHLRDSLARTSRLRAPQHFLRSNSASPLHQKFADPIALKIPTPRAHELMELAASGALFTWRETIRGVQKAASVHLQSQTRNIARVPYELPQRFVLESWEEAVRLDRVLAFHCGAEPHLSLELETVSAVASAVKRLIRLLGSPPDPSTFEGWYRALSKVDASQLTETVEALAYLDSAEIEGKTLRELPVPHFGTKWIEQNFSLINSVLGIDPRQRASGRVTRVSITYADPQYTKQPSNRRYDSLVSGDYYEAPYEARALLIAENHECADRVPPVEGLIAVRGDGKNVLNVARTLAEFFPSAPILYWGDIDEEGLAILSHLRGEFTEVRSILMDEDAWYLNKHLGTSVANDLEIARLNREAPNLTATERLALRRVTSPGTLTPRIEQERIPKDVVARALTKAVASLQAPSLIEPNYIDQPLW